MTLDNIEQEDTKITTNLINHSKKYPELCLKYEQVYNEEIEIITLSGGSFRGSNDGSSQVGFTILISDEEKHGLLIECIGVKSRRIVGSLLGPQKFG